MAFVHAADQLPRAVGIETPAAVFSQNDGSLFAGGSFDRFRKAAADLCTGVEEKHPSVLWEIPFQKLLHEFIELPKIDSRCKADQIVFRQVCRLLLFGINQMDIILLCDGFCQPSGVSVVGGCVDDNGLFHVVFLRCKLLRKAYHEGSQTASRFLLLYFEKCKIMGDGTGGDSEYPAVYIREMGAAGKACFQSRLGDGHTPEHPGIHV